MPDVVVFSAGGYRYIRAGFQYSSGVAAEPGYQIERARFTHPLPIAEGFAAVEAHLAAIGRPTSAFAACELRSPAPFTEHGFTEFNRHYVRTLEGWGIYKDERNPVARTNICPVYNPPGAPSLYAFSYTVPAPSAQRSFIIAGGGEVRDGPGSYLSRVVRRGDWSTAALREKMRCVIGKMEQRLRALGLGWPDAGSTQIYTVGDIGPLVDDELVKTGIAPDGFTWHYSRPPLIDVDYEMDVRGAAVERVI